MENTLRIHGEVLLLPRDISGTCLKMFLLEFQNLLSCKKGATLLERLEAIIVTIRRHLWYFWLTDGDKHKPLVYTLKPVALLNFLAWNFRHFLLLCSGECGDRSAAREDNKMTSEGERCISSWFFFIFALVWLFVWLLAKYLADWARIRISNTSLETCV